MNFGNAIATTMLADRLFFYLRSSNLPSYMYIYTVDSRAFVVLPVIRFELEIFGSSKLFQHSILTRFKDFVLRLYLTSTEHGINPSLKPSDGCYIFLVQKACTHHPRAISPVL